jgi:hypothetical protein
MAPTTKSGDESELVAPPEETKLSRQSQFATKKPDPDVEETYPPDGPHVIEELGKPKEGKIKAVDA